MNAADTYWLGWVGFGLGFLCRGVARVRADGLGVLAAGFALTGAAAVVLAVTAARRPERHGAPTEPGWRSYGMALTGLALFAVGLFELLYTF
ncbi:hypothetical protein ACFPYI_17880 [Halomarina salina]|uniref:Uncharacterized protein n=1 Tax=Halomarina salina TaxID=1872699 RepID=A0ABD5RRR6_9EURY|nr:hypothetical protein [Halomarina salina]